MSDPVARTDGDLARAALAGPPAASQAAYRALMDRHRATAFRLARHHCGDDDAALDVTQQSFISAFAALRRYDPQRPFAHWLARIVLNKCRDRARRDKVRRFLRLARSIEDAYDVAAPAPDPERQTADRQALSRTLSAVAELPAKLKDVLVLRTIEDMTQAETAALLGISEKAVETRLYRARVKLSEILRD